MNTEYSAEQKMTFRQMIRQRPSLVAGICVALFSVVFLAASFLPSSSESNNEVAVIPVETITAEKVSNVEYVRTLSGIIRAKQSSDLAFERSDKIIRITKDEGDAVKKGEVIAIQDKRF